MSKDEDETFAINGPLDPNGMDSLTATCKKIGDKLNKKYKKDSKLGRWIDITVSITSYGASGARIAVFSSAAVAVEARDMLREEGYDAGEVDNLVLTLNLHS